MAKGKGPNIALAKIAFQIGIVSVLAAALVGVGSLVYCMCGFSHGISALQLYDSGRWSQEVKSNIIKTYAFLFASLFVCMVSAVFVFSQPNLFKIFSNPGMVLLDFILEMFVQGGKLFCTLENDGPISVQRLAWVLYCFFLGGLTSSAFLLGPNTVATSIEVTYGVVAVLVFLSLISPFGKFAGWRRYLSVGETVVFVSSIGASFWPLTTVPGAIFFTLSFYGGLIVFPLFFLCHSQEAQIEAGKSDTSSHSMLNVQTPQNSPNSIYTRNSQSMQNPPNRPNPQSPQNSNNTERPYCAISMFVPMLLDALSIFSRVVVLIPSI